MQGALVTGACALALAGCGDDSGEETTGATDRTPASASSPLRRELDRRVSRLLTERGLDPPITDCALAELAESLPDERLESAIGQIRKTGAVPPAVVRAAAAAGEACGRP